MTFSCTCTAPQHLVCRAVQSLHINRMQMSIIEVFICRRLHMNTSMIPVCIWLICRLCTALHTKCCGAVMEAIGVLDPDDETHLFCRHFVYIPRINNHLEQWTGAWINPLYSYSRQLKPSAAVNGRDFTGK